MSQWVSGDRVQWECGAEGCSRQVHFGTITGLSHSRAVEMGLTAEPTPPTDEPYAGVFFDDRPGVLQFHRLSEVCDVFISVSGSGTPPPVDFGRPPSAAC